MEVTILLSNSYQYSSNNNQKQIKIRPIELIRKKPIPNHTSSTIDEEVNAKQNKLHEINRQLDHTKQQNEALLLETQEMIVEEKKQWENEKKQLISKTKELGYKEGFSTGKEESLNHYAEILRKANGIVDSASVDYHAILENSEDVILKLAIESSEKILQKKLEENPESFVNIVKAAIKDIKEQSMISIYLHPDNYQMVIGQKDELSRLLDSDAKLSIYVKDGMKINNCLIEHPFGQIDASIDTQLKQLHAILHEVNMENKQ